MNWTEAGVVIAGIALLVTVLGLVGLRGATLARMKTDIEYLRRDMDTVLKYFRLTPAVEEDRRRRK